MDDGWCKPATKVMKEVPCPPTLSASTTPVDAFSTRQGPEHEKHEKDWGYAIMLFQTSSSSLPAFCEVSRRYSLLFLLSVVLRSVHSAASDLVPIIVPSVQSTEYCRVKTCTSYYCACTVRSTFAVADRLHATAACRLVPWIIKAYCNWFLAARLASPPAALPHSTARYLQRGRHLGLRRLSCADRGGWRKATP